jgi:polar amino acid transport system permease protein
MSASPVQHAQATPQTAPLRIVPARDWWSWVAAAVLIVAVGTFISVIARAKGVRWQAIGEYVFDPSIFDGIRLTLEFTFLAMVIGTALGIVLAVMQLSANPVLSNVSRLYVWFFRGTPLLVQIIFWFNIQLFIPRISIGIIDVETNTLISAFTAALLALSLHEGAYMAEIIRGGFAAVDRGQREAATALGYTPLQTMRRIVLPQAARVIIPPTGNQTISMLKTTSLVSVISAQDLLTRAENIYARNFLVIELLMVASIWYLVLTTILSIAQYFIERHFGRGVAAPRSPGFGFLRFGGRARGAAA